MTRAQYGRAPIGGQLNPESAIEERIEMRMLVPRVALIVGSTGEMVPGLNNGRAVVRETDSEMPAAPPPKE